ncbi:MAG: hypothetical protein Ctma_1442 [Catillopecten margaritatus gill symbiont]|uniref:Damage-inducible protein J n=1 Tax=Catillopecten margaritatus gill symbiont TaxID=3083288 RepID=A0AAU6PI90_9GAMM
MLANVEKSRTNVYLNKVKKEEAKAIFKEYGMGLSDAINIFLTQAVYEKGIPFQVKLPEKSYIPNEETAQVIKEAEAGIGIKETTLDELMQCIKN